MPSTMNSHTHARTQKLIEERKLKLCASLGTDKHCAPVCHSYTPSSVFVCVRESVCVFACFSCLDWSCKVRPTSQSPASLQLTSRYASLFTNTPRFLFSFLLPHHTLFSLLLLLAFSVFLSLTHALSWEILKIGFN